MNRFLKISIKQPNVYSTLLFLYVVWRNAVLGIKWREKNFDVFGKILMVMIIVLILYLIIRNFKHIPKQLLMIEIVCIIGSLFVYYKTGDNLIFFTVGMVFSATGVDFNQIVKTFFKAQLLCLLIILVSYYLSLTVNVVSYFSYGKGFSLGTYHANNLAILVATLYFAFSYSYLGDKYLLTFIMALAASYFVWKITMSRTSSILIIGYPVSMMFFELVKILKGQHWFSLSKLLIVIIIAATVVLTLNYNAIMQISMIDGEFLSRFINGYILLRKYGIHIFGSQIEYVGTYTARELGIQAVILDNAYLKLLLNYGIFATIVCVAVLYKSIAIAYKKKNYSILAVVFLMILSGMSESSVIMPQYNFTLPMVLCNMDSFRNHVSIKAQRETRNRLYLQKENR